MEAAVQTAVETAKPKQRRNRSPETRPTNTKGQFVRTTPKTTAAPKGTQTAASPKPKTVREAVFSPHLDAPEPEMPAFAHGVSPENPLRVWTAGPLMPRDRIVTPMGRLKIGHDYAYHLTSPEQVAWLKAALGKRFWIDTVPEDEEDLRCSVCHWTCRSYPAMDRHKDEAHGRPQYSA